MKKKLLPILLVVALLVTALTITAMATELPPAPNDVSKYANENMKGNFDGVDSVYAYCPVCNKSTTWYALDKGMTGATSITYATNHHFLKTDITHAGGYFYTAANSTVCIYLNGKNLASPSYINLQAKGTLNIIGNGDETVSGGGLGVWDYGATIDIRGGTVNLYGGKFTKTAGTTRPGPVIGFSEAAGELNVYAGTEIYGGSNTEAGGNIGLYWPGSKANVYGGLITGGQAPYGGNIGVPTAGRNNGYAVNNCEIAIHGGTVQNGVATSCGGNIAMMTTGCKLTADGGTVSGGSATNGGNIAAVKDATVTITGGTVSGGTASNWGGNVYLEGSGKLVMSAGTIETGSGKYGGNVAVNNGYLTFSGGKIKNGTATERAGNLYLSQWVGSSIGGATITGGTLEGGSAVHGGSVFMEPGSNVTMTGLTVTGGTASKLGGGFHVSDAQLTLNNCSVSGGSASTWGGNIYADTSSAKVTITGETTVSGGTAPSGGSIAIHDKATLEIQSGTISGGTAPNYGGNIYMVSGTLTQTGGTVSSGTSTTDRGGNIYINSGVTANISNATYEGGNSAYHGGSMISLGDTTIVNTTFTGGTATKYGGNIAVAGGTFSMTGGSLSGGHASGVGGNLYTWSDATSIAFNGVTVENGVAPTGGNLYITGATTFTDCALSVSASASGNGSHFYNDGTATFTGCTLTNGTVMGDGDVVLNNTTANFSDLNMRQKTLTVSGTTTVAKATFNEPAGLHVKSDFTGTVNFASMVGAPESPIYGKALGTNYTSEGNFTGKVILGFDVEEPWACNKGGELMVASCRAVKDGQVTWYADSEEALTYGENADYLWPVIDGTMVLSKDCVIDLAGTNQTITGTGNVTLFDSANADYKTYGSATVTGPAVANTFATVAPDGNTYYMLSDGNSCSFHRLGVKVNGVSLRPSAAGIYYTSNWACDEAMQALVKSFGVAVSLKDQPGSDFATDTDTLYTHFAPEDFASGTTKTSVLITDIFKTDAQNNPERGMKPIYATAYIVLQGQEGNVVVTDTANYRYSMQGVLSVLEEKINDYSAYADTLESFMAKWSEYGVTGEDWSFSFQVAEEIKQLNAMYTGTTAYHGEMHDHANTGGRSDGKQTLETWIKGMKKLKMDFATIVDHDQSRHMYLDEWQQATFIGGTETTGWVTDNTATVSYGMFHMNLIFATAEQFEAFIDEYADKFKPIEDPETGGVIFLGPTGEGAYTYLPETKAYLMELAAAVHEHGGFFAHVHPKQAMQSTNVEDYWFGDWTGLEVQYSYFADRNSAKAQANYQLWIDLLAAGKKIYATAGNDEHDMPTVKALTTIYAPENTAVSLVEQMRAGNFNPGPIGIRMAIGDIPMGKEGDFTGKKLAFVIGNIHESELADGEHNYKVVLFKGSEEVQRWDMPATGENFYQVVEIDENADFYRLEVIDVEGDTIDRVALSQPIWNTK